MAFDPLPEDSASLDRDLQDFVALEQQKAQFQSTVHHLNGMCWDKCVDKVSTKLDSKTETCITNCVERFIDTSLAMTNRFAQLLQRSGNV